nr:hypothetical protein [Lachnospiraceae bacterium]
CVIAKNTCEMVIRHKLDKLRFIEKHYNENENTAGIYIATGYAFYDKYSDSTVEDIRKRADQRMYDDKRQSKRDEGISERLLSLHQ